MNSETRASSDSFATTQWTRVMLARGDSDEARAALGELCEAYYAPVQAFISRWIRDSEGARDLTQEFFRRVLARTGIRNVDPDAGRFRSFLLGAVKHFLADMREHRQALKRNSGLAPEALDAGTDTSPGMEIADTGAPDPEREFDRKWALTLLERALDALAVEYEKEDKSEYFETLKPWLTGDAPLSSQATVATKLGLSEGAAKTAIHRLRRRFRERIKSEIRQTLSDPTQAEHELSCLTAALSA